MFLGVSWVWCLLCILAVTLTAACGGEYAHTIYVDPERGNDSLACLNSSSPSHPCRNLSYALQYCNSSTQYLLQPGTHYLNSTASFTDLHDIAMTGNGSAGTVKVVCADNSGLRFINTENITFGNLSFMYCSSQQDSTSINVSSPNFQLLYTRSALYFSHCATISMYRVVIAGSLDANAITVYNSIGTNTFTHCIFSDNTNLTDCSYLAGGGGVYIEFSYCLPGNNDCENGTEISYTDHNKDSIYIFMGCEFNNNSACTDRDVLRWFISRRQHHTAFGKGGGLSIFFCGNSTNNLIQVTNCTFSGNRAEIGAGMFVEFADTSAGNSVIVSGRACHFFNNTCSEFAGGGMSVGHFLTNSTCCFKGNSVKITSCNFSKNEAMNGGGLQMALLQQEETNKTRLFNLTISEVTFDSNQGRFGAALGGGKLDFLLKGEDPSITITNCTFKNNTVLLYPHYAGPHEVGRGAIYIDGVDIKFCRANFFNFNVGTALVVISATASVTESHVFFSNNSGLNGGAIALLGSARLLINDNTSMWFGQNTAYIAGGAIYKEHSNQAEINNCFVMHSDYNIYPNKWNATFTFVDNFDSGGKSENAIFSTSIEPCAFTDINTVFCWKHWVYSYNGEEEKNCSKFIRTAPGNITIIDNVSYETTPIPILSAYPGEIIQLPIAVCDDFNHSLQIVFTADGNSDSHSGSAMLDRNYAYTSNNNIRVLGTSGGSLVVNLHSVGDRQWHVKLRVNLTKCPPGLLPMTTSETDNTLTQGHVERDSSSSCECNPQKNFAELVQCNTATSASLASGYWMGEWLAADGRQFYVVSSCPSGFCRTARTGFIPLPLTNFSLLNEHICGVNNRKGRGCGECIEGHGPAVNSEVYKCVYCSVSKHRLAIHTTYYILSVYVPLFLLFLAIIVFNIKLTTGPANAFILYSQVISSTMNINADGRLSLDSITPQINLLLNAYKFPYGIFNLKFFEYFVPPEYMCLGTHLNVLDIFLLDYLVAFFPLLMVIAIIILHWITDYCSVCYMVFPRCKKGPSERLRNALIPAFASFILLSYIKFSLTSSSFFSSVAQRNASGHYVWPLHVNYAAQYAYNDKEYIVRYLLPAGMVFLTFVSIPPLMLLDYPLRLFEKVLRQFPWIWMHYPYNKVHTVLDAFQSCYKNEWRCFAGLYFVFRLLVNITNAICFDLLQFILQEVYCIVFALLVSFLKPYKRNYHLLNYVDSLIFLNLAVINLVTLFLYADTRTGTNPSTFAFSVQYILLFLPLLYMVSYMAWCVLPIPINVRARVRKWHRQRSQRMENLIRDMTPESTDDVDWERAEATNRYNPAKSRDSPLHSSVPAPGHRAVRRPQAWIIKTTELREYKKFYHYKLRLCKR